ncbi:MAG TPA: ATP:cob(I)alamin adenosyltransferase, partial [Puia sp.]|nr:ATP:cob(I)alamin adenosyltransferase [Puia sp.]
ASSATPSTPTPAPSSADFTPTLDTLHEVQDRLLTIGSSLATEKTPSYPMPELLPDDIQRLENAIDAMDTVLPPLKSFVLPGGHVAVSTAHVTRCVCRRAERCCVQMQEEKLPINPLVIPYLNRLSDYLFTVARYSAHLLNAREIPWLPRK